MKTTVLYLVVLTSCGSTATTSVTQTSTTAEIAGPDTPDGAGAPSVADARAGRYSVIGVAQKLVSVPTGNCGTHLDSCIGSCPNLPERSQAIWTVTVQDGNVAAFRADGALQAGVTFAADSLSATGVVALGGVQTCGTFAGVICTASCGATIAYAGTKL